MHPFPRLLRPCVCMHYPDCLVHDFSKSCIIIYSVFGYKNMLGVVLSPYPTLHPIPVTIFGHHGHDRMLVGFTTIMFYRVHLIWVGFELTMLVVVGTDYIASCKSNYHNPNPLNFHMIDWNCNVTVQCIIIYSVFGYKNMLGVVLSPYPTLHPIPVTRK
jgi:hypothetical protein